MLVALVSIILIIIIIVVIVVYKLKNQNNNTNNTPQNNNTNTNNTPSPQNNTPNNNTPQNNPTQPTNNTPQNNNTNNNSPTPQNNPTQPTNNTPTQPTNNTPQNNPTQPTNNTPSSQNNTPTPQNNPTQPTNNTPTPQPTPAPNQNVFVNPVTPAQPPQNIQQPSSISGMQIGEQVTNTNMTLSGTLNNINLISQNKTYNLQFIKGKLTIASQNAIIWQSSGVGSTVNFTQYGNLSIIGPNGVNWTNNLISVINAMLVLRNSGTIAIYDSNFQEIWSTGASTPNSKSAALIGGKVSINARLGYSDTLIGTSTGMLISADSKYAAGLLKNPVGYEFAIYKPVDMSYVGIFDNIHYIPYQIFSTPYLIKEQNLRFVMQPDGNFVLYDSNNTPLWNANTENKGGYRLTLETDGNLYIYDINGNQIWKSIPIT